MGWLTKLMGGDTSTEPLKQETASELAEIEAALSSVHKDRIEFIGCLALLAARLAGADSVISDGEKEKMTDVLQKQAHLSKEEAQAVVEIASTKELALDIKHHKITTMTNQITTHEQKKDIIRALFYIACDEDISEIESEKIRSISKALLMPNSLYISLRSEFTEYRSIFKSI